MIGPGEKRHARTSQPCTSISSFAAGDSVLTGTPIPGEFGVRAEDIPPPVHVDGPGRAMPNEVMNALNDALPLLETRSGRAARVAVEILMDTGRRPDEICQLPLDCLDCDGDGKYVLIYTDYKENRLHRRLPIPDSTATLIRGQQAAVRAAFPDTDPRDLVLIPAVSANPHGTKSLRSPGLTMLHRGWVDQLPQFVLTDGGVFPHTAVVAYAYRHTYAGTQTRAHRSRYCAS